VIVLIRVMNGCIEKGQKIKFMGESFISEVEEVGIFGPNMIKKETLTAGEVGYIITGIKEVGNIMVGDTVTSLKSPASESLSGYRKPKPMVYSGLFPIEGGDYENLKDALEKLSLNDSSLDFTPEFSGALGFGFRCGFLGLLHMEIIRERIEREYGLKLLTSAPTVVYKITKGDNITIEVKRPSDFPIQEKILKIEEPYVEATIITPKNYIGEVMKLVNQKRGDFKDMQYISMERVEIKYAIPLSEIIVDFFNMLKSITSGFASLDYEFLEYRPSDLVKLDILVAGEKVDELSIIAHKEKAYTLGREITQKLRKLIPRQTFEVSIQAAIGKRVIARERIAPYRKDVTSGLYGGDITRKRKVLEKQKAGKKRMKKIGRVEIPGEAFMSFYRLDAG